MARKTAKPALRSTDRGGLLSLWAGIALIAFAIGLLLGLLQQTTSASLRWFLHVALGLGGFLHYLVPAFLLWLGVLMTVSARRYVSFLPWILSFLFYLCLSAAVTLLTNVQGFGTLMDYVYKVNQNHAPVNDPAGFGAYLSLAFRRYADTLSPLPGGGWLGMVVAYPLWRLLNTIGASALLIIAMIALFFGLIRRTPASLLQGLDTRRQARRSPQSEPVGAEQPEPAAATADATVEPAADHVFRRPVAAEPVYEPVVDDLGDAAFAEPAQAVPEPQAHTPRAVPIPSYTPPQATPAMEEPEETGFVPVAPGEVASYPDVPAPVRTPPVRAAQTAASVPARSPTIKAPAKEPASVPVQEPAPTKPSAVRTPEVECLAVAAQPPAPPVSAPAQTSPAEPAAAPAAPQTPPARQTPVAVPEREAAKPLSVPAVPARSTQVHEVTTDPAVPLTGERVPVKPLVTAPRAERRMDGMVDGTPRKNQQLQLALANYERPPLRLLTEPPASQDTDTSQIDQARAGKLVSTLASFNISAQVQEVVHGPAITRFAIRLAEGVNVNRLRSVMDNLSVELLAKSPVRAEIPIPGTRLIGIEVSNEKATTVYLRQVLESQKMQEAKTPTTVALGLDITGTPVLCDLMDMPHLLIAGATGSGKSVCINSIITSLLYCASPDTVRLILVDPKFVELQPYNEVPHLLLPVITDPKKAVSALEWVCQEMDDRYQKLQKTGARNIDAYNAKLGPDEEKLTKLIVIVDEMADLMVTSGKIIDEHIKRITAKARAAGICLILATQRPSVDVITGVIKANIPSRIAFQVSSLVDSRTILDGTGAEKLLGFGDMLYLPRNYSAPKRVQGCLITDADVGRVVDYVKSRNTADYNTDILEHIESGGNESNGNGGAAADDADSGEFDELLPKAIEMAVEAGQMSISMLQRVLRVGYGRAGRLIDEMARRGIISGNEGTKARKTLITREEYGSAPLDL